MMDVSIAINSGIIDFHFFRLNNKIFLLSYSNQIFSNKLICNSALIAVLYIVVKKQGQISLPKNASDVLNWFPHISRSFNMYLICSRISSLIYSIILCISRRILCHFELTWSITYKRSITFACCSKKHSS